MRASTQALIAENKPVLRTRDGGDDADDGDDNGGGDDDDDAKDNGDDDADDNDDSRIQEVRAPILLKSLDAETSGCLYVFVKIDFEILTKLVVWGRFRHARAAERACGLYGIM